MVYIGKHGAETLQKYKYSGIDRSYLAKYMFQPFWSKFVTIFPLWMPPNMITLTGFFFVIFSALLSYIYNPRLDSPSPNWVHFAHGLLLFLYQTFDAVDGKQARRTSSSSPLGELFDHGCDALTCTFETMAFGNTFMCGKHTFLFWAISAVPFYCATWESFFTNTLILPEINGPTEGLMLIYLVHIFTGFVGPSWWARPVKDSFTFLSGFTFISDMPVYDLVLVAFFLSAFCPTVSYNIYNVYKVVRARNGSLPIAFSMLFPFMALVGGTTIWALLSPSDIMGTRPHLVLLGTGFAFGYQVGRMILAHLCDEPKGLKTGMCMPLLFLPLGIANALSAGLLGGVSLINEQWLLVSHCAFVVSLYAHFAINVIHEITACLGIHCFRIGRKEA